MSADIIISGKRKEAVAKVRISRGDGKIFYNSKPHSVLGIFHRLALEEPARICRETLGNFDFNVVIKARGGGKEGQIQAARLGIAKALVKITNSQELKKAFLKYDRNLLVGDVRRKEAYKPGDSKARAKRQKSYR